MMAKAAKAKEKNPANGRHAAGKGKANGSAVAVTKPADPVNAAKPAKRPQGKAEPAAAIPDKAAGKSKALRTRPPKAYKSAKAKRKRPAPKPGFFESFLKLFR
jgi:hypothetical protein